MAYKVYFEAVGQGYHCFISDYLVVYPFSFDQQGRLSNQPQQAVAFFNLITTQVAAERSRRRQTRELPLGKADFKVMNEEHEVLNLNGFKVVAASTPASLDRSRATWVLRGAQEGEVTVEFYPLRYSFSKFGKTTPGNAYWGAELRDAGEVLLHASLSVPVYGYQSQHLSEYLALGPAGAADGSIFSWLLQQTGSPKEGGDNVAVGGRLRDLVVRDLTNDETNQVFGGDKRETQNTKGAVFVMNGNILGAEWPTVAELVRELGEESADDEAAIRFLQRLPGAVLYQTVVGTMLPDTRATGEFAIATPDFEGIMVWGLPDTRADVVPMHR